MRIKVDLFQVGGKWKYGGIIEVSERWWLSSPNDAFFELVRCQRFVVNDAFEHHIVVASNEEDCGVEVPFVHRLYFPNNSVATLLDVLGETYGLRFQEVSGNVEWSGT